MKPENTIPAFVLGLFGMLLGILGIGTTIYEDSQIRIQELKLACIKQVLPLTYCLDVVHPVAPVLPTDSRGIVITSDPPPLDTEPLKSTKEMK